MKRISTIAGVCLSVVASGLAASQANAGVVNLNPTNDAVIYSNVNNANGKGAGLFAGADGSGGIKRSVLEFDVSSIPTNATITGVTLTLYLGIVGGNATSNTLGDRLLGLHTLLQGWTEGPTGASSSISGSGQGSARANGDVTYDYANYNTNGALATLWGPSPPILGGNFTSASSATFTVPNAASFTSGAFALSSGYAWSGSGLVSDVQAWVNGSMANDGWLLKSENMESTSQSVLGFWSKDGASANSNGLAPVLSVTFTTPAPEPGTLAVVGVIPLLLMARRGSRSKTRCNRAAP